MIPKNLEYETSFTVMPEMTNAMWKVTDSSVVGMIFGGAFWSQLDLASAACVKRALYDSETCSSAVTFKSNVTFLAACYLGDLVFIEANLVELRRKAMVVEVVAHREKAGGTGVRDKVAYAEFVFVSKKVDEFVPHGLEMP